MIQRWVSSLSALVPAPRYEGGQGMVEYALLIALVALALVLAPAGLVSSVSAVFSDFIALF